MSFISYAQNFEDVMLWRALKHIDQGFYIDVGANDPDHFSVTKAFYELGWRGINVEPIRQWFECLEKARPRDINLQLALGAEPGEITLYEIPDTGLSTAEKKFAERHEAESGFQSRKLRVKMDTLTRVCERVHPAQIHFLKIDAEGAEKAVLQGADFEKIRPWIILLEATLPLSMEESHSDWEPLLLNAGYEYAYFDGLNRFYVAGEHENLKASFKVPPNIFDEFIKIEQLKSERQAQEAEAKVKEVEQRAAQGEARAQVAETLARLAEERAELVEAAFQKVINSRSWRVTQPLRWLANSVRKNAALSNTSNGSAPAPTIAAPAPTMTAPRELMELSPRAREIYFQLIAAIDKNQENI